VPGIVEAILAGRQPRTVTRSRLATIDLRIDWQQQRRMLGFVRAGLISCEEKSAAADPNNPTNRIAGASRLLLFCAMPGRCRDDGGYCGAMNPKQAVPCHRPMQQVGQSTRNAGMKLRSMQLVPENSGTVDYLVRPRRLELPRPFGHNDLNVARLPVPPWPHDQIVREAFPSGRRGRLAQARAFAQLPSRICATAIAHLRNSHRAFAQLPPRGA